MKSGNRLLAVLGLFSDERPSVTVEAAAKHLTISASTMYRYFAALAEAGLIEPGKGATYVLGPAILQYDWQIRMSDSMLAAAKPVMRWLLENAPEGSAVLLCRLYRDRVMCVHQEVDDSFEGKLSYERGRPMPMFRGAPSKIILASLPRQTARELYKSRAAEFKDSGMGATCQVVSDNLRELRRLRYSLTRSDIDPGRVSIAAAIFERDERVAGSIAAVIHERAANEPTIARLVALTSAAAAEISVALSAQARRVERPAARAKMLAPPSRRRLVA